jgi:hypothetical protein
LTAVRLAIAAALALVTASSLDAQAAAPAAPAAMPDLTFAVPLAGTWYYSASANGSQVVFRSESSRLPQLTIRCAKPARHVTIAKPASAAAPFLFVWTSSLSKSFSATFDPATAQLSATLESSNALLDALAFSRGRFGVSVSGAPALVLPAWGEVGRVIEDCRV